MTTADRAHADRRARRRALLLGVLLPLGVALLVAVQRLGADGRAAAVATAVESAAVLADDPSLPAGARAVPADHRLAVYRRDGDDFPITAAAGPDDAGRPEPPAMLPPRLARELLARDRAFGDERDGRIIAVAPLKDADRWEIVGALLLEPLAPPPARLPVGPLAIGLLVLTAAALAADAFVRRPSLAAVAGIAAGPLAFGAWMLAFEAAPEASTFRLWTVAALGGWAVVAAIALGLAREPARLREGAVAWMFLAPSLLHLLLFSVGPILFSLWLSFHEWNLIEPDRPFVGLDNYRRLAGDGDFWRAVRNTAVYVLFVPAGMAVALGLALFVNRRIPGVGLLRAVFFLPYVTSFVAISLVWKWMFEPDFGLLNAALRALGLPPQPWLASPATALPSLMLMSVWMYAGYMMVIFLAGLQSIPASLYESAQIDGASAWQRFRRITLPMLRPTLFFILVTMVIFMFQVFTAVYVMTEGGPLHATDVIVYHIYRNAWEYLRMGYASAMAWVLFAIVFVITLVQFRWLGRRVA